MNKKFFIFFIIIFTSVYSGYKFIFINPRKQEQQKSSSQDALKKTNGLIEKDHLKIIVLPKPTGPFNVGTKPIHVQDVTRPMVHEKNKRHWVIQAFYPAKPHQFTRFRPRHTFGYANQIYFASKIGEYFIESHAEPIGSILKNQSGGIVEYPVLIIVPDITKTRWDYTIICEQLASMGYIVLIWDQPYIARVVNLKYNKPLRPYWSDLWKSSKNEQFKKKILVQALKNQQGDLNWILNNLTATLHFMRAKSNQQIILMGHGYGASVIKTIHQDNKIAGIIEYAPKDISAYEQELGSFKISKSKSPTLQLFTAISEKRKKTPFDFQYYSFDDPIIQKNNNHSKLYTIANLKAYENTILDYGYFSDKIPIINIKPNWWLFLSHMMGNWDVLHTQGLDHKYKDSDEFYRTLFHTIESWLKNNRLFPKHTPSPEEIKHLKIQAKQQHKLKK
ncbi:MAG: hypothetical protein C0432_03385 [Candidatus Puniceispirillum sp.]|nr:hypothetical protein [Candidatus Pelagibacter sp.]MBA4283317.1 hypothetical protein [Candidatus Puniceispirillum sp.]